MWVLLYLAFFLYWAYLLVIWWPASLNRRAGKRVVVLSTRVKVLWTVLCVAIPLIGVLVVTLQIHRLHRALPGPV